MRIKSTGYQLTLNSILGAMDSFKRDARPLFRIKYKLDQYELNTIGADISNDVCPMEEKGEFERRIEDSFSIDLALSKCQEMTQGNMLYFLLGGYRRFTTLAPEAQTRLFNGYKTRPQKKVKQFAKDLSTWKYVRYGSDPWFFTKGKLERVPTEEVTLIEYIIQCNRTIISTYCSLDSQEDLLSLLKSFSMELVLKSDEYRRENDDYREDISLFHPEMNIIDLDLVNDLSELLDPLTRLAEGSKGSKKSEYLAEGLTWLLIASLLRGNLSALRGELSAAKHIAINAAAQIGIIETEEREWEERSRISEIEKIRSERNAMESLMEYVGNIVSESTTKADKAASGSKEEDDELRDYLAEVLKQKRSSHPSFQLLAADEIDSRLYPNIKEYRQIEPMGKAPSDSDGNNKEICPVWEIIRGSWSAPEHRSVVILGEGGIGKTVTLFSIASPPDGTLSVPALYIPMYELAGKDGKILELDEYISKRYRRYSGRIDTLATQPWDDRPRLLVLLDGFNEIPFSLRRNALDVINEWHEVHPGAQVIAVSRPMDGLDLTRELAGVPIPVTLTPLEESTILEYLKEAGRKIPAKGSPVWEDLRYPLFLNLYVRTGRLRGKTPAGYPLRVMDADSGGALIWNFLQRELLRHKADRTEKAEDWILRCAIANEYILPYLAYRMVAGQRMEISYDEAAGWTDEVMSQFDGNRLPQHLKAVWETYRRRHGSFPGKDILQPDVWRDTVLRDSGMLIPLAGQNSESDIMNDKYAFMHQHFRDCLAGLYLVNQAETAEDDGLPEVWRHSQNYLALDYAAELMDEDTADRLWEINRKNQQYKSPGYKKDISGTYALLELQKRRKTLPKKLDFSGMDLRGISLTRYMSNENNAMPLFQTAHLTRDTKLDRSTFQSEGHFSAVTCILSLPDGRIVTGSFDRTLRVWNPSTGQCLQILKGHTDSVECVAVLPDGRIVSGSWDKTLRVWDPSIGQCLQVLKGHSDSVSDVAILPDGRVVSGSDDHSLRVWDPSTGQCLHTLKGHTDEVNCVAVLSDRRIVSSSYDGTLRVWDSSTGQCLQTLVGHSDRINCLIVLLDSLIVSGSKDKSLRVWNPSTGQCLQILEGHTRQVSCAAVLPDGRIVSGSWDKTLRIWDPSTGQCLQTLEWYTGVRLVTVLQDGRIVSSAHERSSRVWDLSTGQCVQTLEGHNNAIACMAVFPDRRIISGLKDNSLRLWDSLTGQCLKIMKKRFILSYAERYVAILPDGRIVVSSYDRSLQVWDPSTGQCLQTLVGHSAGISCLAVLLDGRIVSGSLDASLRVWDPSTAQCLQILKGHTDSIECVAVLPDGRIVSGSWDKTLRVWDPLTGQRLQILEGHSDQINCVAVFPDGRIVSGSWDKTLRVWDPSTAQCLQILKGHTDSVNGVAVLPNGQIVSGSWDKTLRVWNPSTGQCIHTLRRNTDSDNNIIITYANYILVLPDGRIVSDSCLYTSYSLKVWDPITGQCLQTLEGHTSPICCVSAFPDGRVISGSYDGIIKLWNPDTGKCIETMEMTDIDVSQMDLSNAVLTDDLAKLLWQNSAKIPNMVNYQHSQS